MQMICWHTSNSQLPWSPINSYHGYKLVQSCSITTHGNDKSFNIEVLQQTHVLRLSLVYGHNMPLYYTYGVTTRLLPQCQQCRRHWGPGPQDLPPVPGYRVFPSSVGGKYRRIGPWMPYRWHRRDMDLRHRGRPPHTHQPPWYIRPHTCKSQCEAGNKYLTINVSMLTVGVKP